MAALSPHSPLQQIPRPSWGRPSPVISSAFFPDDCRACLLPGQARPPTHIHPPRPLLGWEDHCYHLSSQHLLQGLACAWRPHLDQETRVPKILHFLPSEDWGHSDTAMPPLPRTAAATHCRGAAEEAESPGYLGFFLPGNRAFPPAPTHWKGVQCLKDGLLLWFRKRRNWRQNCLVWPSPPWA